MIKRVARFAVAVSAIVFPFNSFAQTPGPNINMVAGTQWPGGDPFLQRQDEPSMAASTRNPLHLLAGANDYRTVDLPGLPNGEETGDAWLGVFKSLDGGQTWFSTLIPGYPQDTGPIVPIKGFPAAADPMVRSGLNGMFYYSGIALTRDNPPISAVFVARFNDFNNREGSDPIQYSGMSIVADGRPASQFLDKPSLAVDIPRAGSSLCSVGGQFFLGGNVYVVYTLLEGTGQNTIAKLWFSRSTNCGTSWSNPILISGANSVNQASVMAIDTRSGALHVVWRRFAHDTETNAILATKSIDGGKTFSAPVVIRNIAPYDQVMSGTKFRTNDYPTAVTDADGRLYVAWTERNGPAGTQPWSSLPDGRIMLTNSPDGHTWTTPVMVAPTAMASPLSGRGHQFMPALSYASGKLMLVHYDLREDSTIAQYAFSPPSFTESRLVLGNLSTTPQNLDNVFNNFVQDAGFGSPLLRRHTLDLRASQASPGAMPVFEPSQRVSAYRFGFTSTNPTIRQLEFNPPNFDMFKKGTVPFIGDYVDLAPQYPFIASLLNFPIPAPVFHAVWTDNRDVRPPLDGDWTKYTPPYSAARGFTSKLDGSVLEPCIADRTGMRNQNIYTARITAGLFFGSPGNDKPLGRIQRAFVVTVQNAKATSQSYRLQIFNQPPGGKATFQQLPQNAPAVTTLDITIHAKSSASRTVFVTSTSKDAPVGVTVTEIPAPGGTPQANALISATVLNPDPSSPDIGSPTPGSPDIGSVEVYTPDIGAPDIGAPDIGAPDIGAPDIGAPDIGTPDIGTPDIGTPDIGTPTYASPDIGTPDIGTPDIGSGSVTDTSWPVTNDGNTTAAYATKLYLFGTVPPDVKLQLILHQTYRTPTAKNCTLMTERHEILLANQPNPTLQTSLVGIGNPDIGSSAVPSVAIAPGDSVKLTVRVVDKNPSHDPARKGARIPATNFLAPVVVAQAINTTDLNNPNNPNPQPPISMVITTPSLPDGITGSAYSAPLNVLFGVAPLTWSVASLFEGPPLPSGVSIDTSTGLISGIPAQAGTFSFTVTVQDSTMPNPRHTSRVYTIHIADLLVITTKSPLPVAAQGSAYNVPLASRGGLRPIHWALLGGALPAGFTLSDGGLISGTSTSAGTFSFAVGATDSSQPAQTIQGSFQLVVAAPVTFNVTPTSTQFVMSFSPVSISGSVTNNSDVTQSGLVIQHYIDQGDITIPAAGWVIRTASDFADGTVPAHTQLQLISGDHAANASGASAAGMQPGSATLRIQLRQQQGGSDNLLQTLSFPITLTVPLAITTPSLPDGYQGSSYNDGSNPPNPFALSSSGGTGTVTWRLGNETTLPNGLTLSSNGGISGNPTGVEYRTVAMKATDSGSPAQTVTKNFTIQTWSQASAFCPSPSKPLFNNMNGFTVFNGGLAPTFTTPNRSYRLVAMSTYHYNDGAGTSLTGHTLGLSAFDPWTVNVTNAQGGVPANWEAVIPSPGPTLGGNSSYTVNDSDGSKTWSQNSGSGGFGFTQVCVVPLSP
ncbi:MAG: putative Ig domain-containing protein [Acidobacteriota bacterium]|nr:putative Ig domain-containing protein [Acidobacteriota bacterium]